MTHSRRIAALVSMHVVLALITTVNLGLWRLVHIEATLAPSVRIVERGRRLVRLLVAICKSIIFLVIFVSLTGVVHLDLPS